MRMIRSFLPVGQGAFYTERFQRNREEQVFIYDCGSCSNEKILEKEIRSNFTKGQEIEAIFISHFHDDHVNGLPYLLNYCNVKRIFFPFLSQENRIFMKIQYLLNENSENKFSQTLLEEELEEKSMKKILEKKLEKDSKTKDIKVFFIKEDLAEGLSSEVKNIEYLKSPIVSGEKITPDDFTWLYIPFNIEDKEKINILVNGLKAEFPDLKNLDKNTIIAEKLEAISKNKDNLKKIRKVYGEIEGDLNTNSMTLFSGLKCRKNDFKCYQTFYHYQYNRFFWRDFMKLRKEIGCLYTGDYNAKKNYDILEDAYKNYWDSIGCIQIPHHGSKDSYNEEFSKKEAFFIISAGYANSYRHPHGIVVRDLILNNKEVFIVTEKVGSREDFWVEFSRVSIDSVMK